MACLVPRLLPARCLRLRWQAEEEMGWVTVAAAQSTLGHVRRCQPAKDNHVNTEVSHKPTTPNQRSLRDSGTSFNVASPLVSGLESTTKRDAARSSCPSKCCCSCATVTFCGWEGGAHEGMCVRV